MNISKSQKGYTGIIKVNEQAFSPLTDSISTQTRYTNLIDELHKEIDELHKEIDDLDETVVCLRSRLSPFASPELPSEPCGGALKEEPVAPALEQLKRLIDHVRNLNYVLVDLKSRLQI